MTAEALAANGVTKVGLLGTQFTMGEDFYKSRVSEKYAIEVIVPEKPQQEIVHNIIYSELIMGEINDESRQQYLEVIDQLHSQGAQAVILGCTEIALLVQQNHTKIPLYDTTEIHAAQAVKLALSEWMANYRAELIAKLMDGAHHCCTFCQSWIASPPLTQRFALAWKWNRYN